jgi:hypothetical protein
MKKIYILLLLFTFSLNLFSQENDPNLPDSTISYTWNTEINDWINESSIVYTFDANGNEVDLDVQFPHMMPMGI